MFRKVCARHRGNLPRSVLCHEGAHLESLAKAHALSRDRFTQAYTMHILYQFHMNKSLVSLKLFHTLFNLLCQNDPFEIHLVTAPHLPPISLFKISFNYNHKSKKSLTHLQGSAGCGFCLMGNPSHTGHLSLL